MRKFFLALTILILLTTTVTSQDIVLPSEDSEVQTYSPSELSRASDITKYVKLTGTSDDANTIDNNDRFRYEYINTSGTSSSVIDQGNLNYTGTGDWWNTTISDSSNSGTNEREINYGLQDSGGNWIHNETESVAVSDMQVNIPDVSLTPGKEETISFTVSNGEVDSGSSAIYLLEGAPPHTSSGSVLNTGSSSGEVQIQAPDAEQINFRGQILAGNSDGSTDALQTFRATTTESLAFDNSPTIPENECEGNPPATCYPGSELTVDYDTTPEPDYIDVETNYGGSTIETNTYGDSSTEIGNDERFSIELPTAQEIDDEGIDISNTGLMEIDIKPRAYNGDVINDIKSFDFEEFEINIGAIPTLDQGLEHTFDLQLQHPETGEDLGQVANLDVSIVKDGATKASYNLNDFETEDGIYTKEVTINQSTFETGSYTFEVSAKSGIAGGEDSETQVFSVQKIDFKLDGNETEGKTFQRGNTYEMPFNLSKTGSDQMIQPSKIEASNSNITIYKKREEEDDQAINSLNVTETKFQEWYDDSEEKYYPEASFDIDAETGDYYVKMNISIAGEWEEEKYNFQVIEQPEVFDLEQSEIAYSPTTFGNYTKNIGITNLEEEDLDITTSKEETLEKITINEGEDITLENDSTNQIELKLNYNNITEYDGEIEFNHTPTETTRNLDLEVQEPVCFQKQETICSKIQENIINTVEETGEQTKSIEILNFDGESDVELDLSGNLTDIASLSQSNTTIEGEDQINYTIDPLIRGNFTGTLELEKPETDESLEWEIEAESDITPQDLSATATDINIGSIGEGSDQETEIEIENTGNQNIEENTIQIEDYGEITNETGQIPRDETRNATIEMQNITEIPSNLDIEISGTSGTETIQTTLSGNIIEDVTENTDQKYSEYRELENQNTEIPIDIQDQIESGKNALDDADLAWENGNYQKAKDKYEEAEETYQTAQTDLQTLEQEREQEQQNQDQQQEQQQEDSGSILPIIFIIVLILSIAGFVIYSSVELEPGDPLYEYLGDYLGE